MKEEKQQAPEITVLMSCYNGSRWLDEAIKSVLNQTFDNFEFIIVDDGSLDNSLSIIKHHSEKDSRIVVITKSNTGLADSLNVGIGQARGEWIARLDADDICEPNRLEKQLALAKDDPRLVFIGSGLLEIDENGNGVKSFKYPEHHALLVKNLYSARKFPPHSSAMYRTNVVREMGGYRPRIKRAEDCDLWMRMSESGELGAIKEPLVRIRKHAGQISHDEAGRRQKVDSRVAMTSYWLRRLGFPDPVAADDIMFESFHGWVADRLSQEQFFELWDFIKVVKEKVVEITQSPISIFLIIKFILGKPHFFFRFLRFHLIGDLTARRLALDWASKEKDMYGASSEAG